MSSYSLLLDLREGLKHLKLAEDLTDKQVLVLKFNLAVDFPTFISLPFIVHKQFEARVQLMQVSKFAGQSEVNPGFLSLLEVQLEGLESFTNESLVVVLITLLLLR